ncbi:MAG: EAL domain-containing protein [Sulfuricellaceae bacterium]
MNNEEIYRNFINLTSEGYWMMNAAREIVDVNDALCRMLGYTREEILGRRPGDFVDEANRKIFIFQSGLINETLHRIYDITLKSKSGEDRHARFNATSVCDAAGNLLHSFAFITDVSELRRVESELRLSLSEQEIILENAGFGIALTVKQKFVWVNRQLEELLGYARGALQSVPTALIHPSRQALADFANGARAVMRHGQPYRTERQLRRRDGTLVWCRIVGKALNASDLLNGALWIIEDMSGYREAEENLRLAAKVFDSSVEGILITDAASRIVNVNRAFTQITGYTAAETIGQSPTLLSSGKHDAAFYQNLWASLKEVGQWRGEIWNRRKNGEIYPEWLTISAVKNEKKITTNYVAVFSDITSRKQAEEHLNYLVNHDALTGLPNRTLFLERLMLALAHAHRNDKMAGVMFFDLDRFKIINDTLGHASGDLLLQAVAQRVGAILREGDTVARLGGDEFTVIVEGVSSEKDIAHIAQKIIDAIAKPLDLCGQEVFVTASVGISVYPNDGVDTQTLVKNADAAMYRAKDQGKNNYQFFKADMNARAFERLTLENSLRRALERSEFELYYQPQRDIATGQVVGAEALIRWRHPEMGLVLPDRFIPIAEETGMILPIGEWVMRTACAQNKAWQDAGFPLMHIAVNLSGRQFKQKNLVGVIKGILAETGLDAEYLELEITESVIMEQATETIATLGEMKALGLQLSIDDFGTGYSSLSYLKRFPIDTLKIDRSFVRDITTDEDDAAITTAVIALAHSLKLMVIAEGVETAEQLAFLSAHGCDEMQGYYFSRPLTAEAFGEKLANRWIMPVL